MTEELQFFSAGLDPNIVSIDLHNAGNISDALDQMERELFAVYNTHQRYCRVIHGIGEGKLAEAVHNVFKKNPLIRDWHCEGGSCIVLF